ncbi:polysaccharide deactylase family protein, PEP-CTERM locus subfamily [Thermodesulfatator indicus DSM 15286]|uniref:Polysaccharide deactylase family protein, PEP-CTERM locus subfamily n=2 Tax=Thermodesulfatator indicus TaxID=171695 RepID=F8AC26_THEID|nr:polysaccharide deactylase family protein, PEP-CTERM locus subfamily [Thermodesulfatator indicus DSM 15286]
MINALSVDVEEYFQVVAFAKVVKPEDWDVFPPRVEKNTKLVLDLLAEEGVKATFFCLGWVAKKYPALIRLIAQAGHEVASHGVSHKPLFEMTPEEFRKEARESKKVLEDIAGQEVLGFRASTYSVTRKTIWALKILAEEGYAYDSSIFPIYHDLYGIPSAPRRPFVIKEHNLKEFPVSTARLGKMNIPVAGGGYFRLFPYFLTRYLLKRVNKKEKLPFVFYVHPWEFDPSQPRIKAPLKSRFRHYQNLSKTKKRFHKLLKDFSFAPLKEVLKSLESLPKVSLKELVDEG